MYSGVLHKELGVDARPTGGVLSFFRDIPDPRSHNVRYRVADIIAMTIMAVVSGAYDWAMVVEHVESKAKWLNTFTELLNEATPYSFGKMR